MSLLDLPDRVILRLAEFIHLPSSLRCLHRTSKRLSCLLTPVLHTFGATDNLAATALCYAAASGNSNLVRFILRNAANLVIRASAAGKLLYDGIKGPRYTEELVTLLLDPRHRNNFVITDSRLHGTPLHWAAKHGSEAVMAGLLEMGINVDTTDRNGGTALSWAAYNGNTKVIRMLLDKNANVMIKDRMGQRPVNYAAAGGKEDAVYMLNEARNLQKEKVGKEGKGEKRGKRRSHRPREPRVLNTISSI